MKPSSLLTLLLLLSAETLAGQEKITLLFAGDLMQHQAQIDAARTPDGYDYADCFKYVKSEILRADVAIGNLEVTMGGKPYSGYPAFSAPDEYLHAMKEAGFDVLLTANNHCLDTGKRGLERTIALLDSLGLPHAGTYSDAAEREVRYPLRIAKNGFVIALLNYTYGTNGLSVRPPAVVNYIDKEVMSQDIRKAKAMHPDAIIACIHWGIEYQSLPDERQKELADWLLAQGVTHVIGGHPHVLQPMELRDHPTVADKQVVAYSLGNCLSNMSARHTDGGAMLRLELTRRHRITRLSHCGYSLIWTSRPSVSGHGNYRLYPISIDKALLNQAEYSRMKRFVEEARRLLDAYNVGVEEYIFE